MTMTGHRTRSVFDRYNVVADEDVDRARELIERAIATEHRSLGHVLVTLLISRDPRDVRQQDKSAEAHGNRTRRARASARPHRF
jgi:hypothetical protein